MAFEAIKNAINNAAQTGRKIVKAAQQIPVPKTYSWSGKTGSQMSTLEKTAYLRMNSDKESARDAFKVLSQEMQSVNSRHYSPYLTGKSNQKEAMEFFGVDSFDQNWLDNNRFLLKYTSQLDWTDTISTSGQAKWSDAQKAGYYYHMLSEAEQTTQQAEQEWANLRTDMQKNFNEYKRLYGKVPSYDQLMGYINMSDYSTLQKMDKVYHNVEDIVRLNRSVNYSPETVLGVYAALINGKDVTGEGNYFEDAVQYTMQPLKEEQEERRANYSGWTKEQIEGKRQEIRKSGTRADLARFEADLYASTPHLDSVDSESYFSETYYDQNFFDKYAYLGEYAEQLRNRDGKIEKPSASDPWWYGAAYEYSQIEQREEATRAAEQEWTALRKDIQAAFSEENSPEDVLNSIDWEDYPTLEKIRKGQDVSLNRAVYFSDEAILGVLRAAADGEDVTKDDFDYAFYESGPENSEEEKDSVVSVQDEGGLTIDESPVAASIYFQGPSAYNGKIEGIDYAVPDKKAEDPSSDKEDGPKYIDGYVESPYANPDKVTAKPEVYGPFQQTEEGKVFKELELPEEKTVAEKRREFMENLWQETTRQQDDYIIAIEKEFYETHGRPMTQGERAKYGLAPRPLEEFDPSSVQLGVFEPTGSIFNDTYNQIAGYYENPKTGKPYENMDELIANDPALLSEMIDYVETNPQQQTFTMNEGMHLAMLRKYQEELDKGAVDDLFRAYAEDHGTEAKLDASLNYIIQSGLTLEDKDALGLLDNNESMELIAQRSQELMVERGNEMTRAMAIAILPDDVPEEILNITDFAISNLFAIESGIAGGVLETQTIPFNAARDLWSAAMMPIYMNQLGDDYTLDQACEIDPMLRGLTAAVDKGNALTDIASPDMSNYSYGAGFVQSIVESAVSQKAANFYSPAGKKFVSSALDKLGLNSNTLSAMLGSDKAFTRFFAKAIDSAAGSVPWMLRSMSDGAQQARDMGASEADAIKYGIYSGGTTGMIEGALGQAYDSLLTKGSNLISKGLSAVTKGGMDDLLSRRDVTFVTNMLQQAFGEGLEEAAEMPLDKIGRSAFLGEALKFSGEDAKETWENMKMGFVSSLFTSAFFGLTADKDTKEYTDSEKLLERIESGRATVDEMMGYAMDQGDEYASVSDVQKVLGRTTPGKKVDPDAEPEENRYSLNELLGRDKKKEEKSQKFRPKTAGELKIIHDEKRESAEQSAHSAPVESNYIVRDSVRIMQENQAMLDEAAIDMAAEAVVEQQIADGAMDDISGPASANAKTMAQFEVRIESIRQKAEQEAQAMEQLDAQKEAALYHMISNGISPDKGAARQTIHNFDEARAAAQKRHNEYLQKLSDEENAKRMELDHVQAQVEQRRKEMKAAVVTQKRAELEEARKKVDEDFAKHGAEMLAAIEQATHRKETKLEWADNDWGKGRQAISVSSDNKHVLLRDSDGSLRVALMDEKGRVMRRVSVFEENILEKIIQLTDDGNPYAEYASQLLNQFEADPVRFVTRMNSLTPLNGREVSGIDRAMIALSYALKSEGIDLMASPPDEIIFADKRYSSEEEAIADDEYQWSTTTEKTFIPEKQPIRMRSEATALDTAIDQIIWGEDDVYAPLSAQSMSDNRREEWVDDGWEGFIKESADPFEESKTDELLKNDDFIEVSEEEYDTYSGLMEYLRKHGIQISPEHLKKHYDARTENDPIRTQTDGEYTTVASSDDGRFVLVVNSKAWGSYNEAMADYKAEQEAIYNGYKELPKEKNDAKRNALRQKLDEMKRNLKKPDSPKGTYILLDMNRVASDDAENPIRDQVEFIRARIDNRIAELERQADEANDVGRIKGQVEELRKLQGIVGGSDYRRIMDKLRYFAKNGNEKNFKTQVVKKLLEKLPGIEELDRSEKDSAKRFHQITVALYNNKNQAIDGLKDFAGVDKRVIDKRSPKSLRHAAHSGRRSTAYIENSIPRITEEERGNGQLYREVMREGADGQKHRYLLQDEHRTITEQREDGRRMAYVKDRAHGVKTRSHHTAARNGIKMYGSDPIYYASADLMNALSDLSSFYTGNGKIDINSLGEAYPGVFFAPTAETNVWDQEAADARFKAPYESKLASDNGKYIAIDRADGFNLVVAKKDTRIDARQTGNVRVNPNVYSVSDAKHALQIALDGMADQMKRQKALHDQKHLSRKQMKYYQAMVICTVKDANGNEINKSAYDFTNATGGRSWPSAERLFGECERITVNYTAYDTYHPKKEVHIKDRTTGEIEMREKMVPDRDGGQDQYRFTLEKTEMAPGAAVENKVDTGADMHESPIISDLKRAEEDYVAYAGRNASPVRLRYFANVCDANYHWLMKNAVKLNERLESGKTVDAELASIQEQLNDCKKAMTTWQYIGDRVALAIKTQNPDAMKAVMKKYDALMKEGGGASLEARMKMASAMRKSMMAVRQNQLKASIPQDATLQSLMREEQELQAAMEEIMNARNQAAVLNHASPSSMNNEPLLQAVTEQLDTVHRQMELVADRPEINSAVQNEAPVPEIETSANVPEEVEGSVSEAAENGSQELTDDLHENAENDANDANPDVENADPVRARQEMDRSYLKAIIGEEDADFASWYDNEELEAHGNQTEQPELIDMETGESVRHVDEVTGSEYADAETGEIRKAPPDVSAEDLSYAAPVEEFMERAGLVRGYIETAITSPETHEQAERQADAAHQAVKALTDRINAIQTALQSGVLDEGQTAAIQAEKKRYIDERNRIKAVAKRLEAAVDGSEYVSAGTVNNIVNHCLENGNVNWEAPEVRARDINAIYDKQLAQMKARLQKKLYAGKTTALTVQDVAEIIGSDELTKSLRLRYDVGFGLSRRLHEMNEAVQVYEQQREEIQNRIEAEGASLELEAERGRIDDELNMMRSRIENGQKAMRMYFDSGSEMSLEDILAGKGGGRLPLNIMNRIYAILKDVDAQSKNTNRPANVLSHADNPLRAMEHFTGEWAPLFNALYIGQVQGSNAKMNAERGSIVNRLQNSGIQHRDAENAMLYAEGKMTEAEFEEKYPNPSDRDRIKRGILEYRKVYDNLFKEVNEALVRNGFDAIPYRKDYIHHMRDAQSGIAKVCAKLGIRITEDELPTAIAGHTEENKPRRGFMSASMERHGDETSYDLERNTMAYVDAALRVIHHTDNISRLRQLEGIMDQTQNKRAVNSGLAQYSEVVDTNDLKRSGRSSKTAFSSMREWVTEYTNLLAGKQSFIDRPIEKLAGRNALQIANSLKNMTGSSIVVGNLNIATSNILPVMTMAGISPVQTAAALADVVRGGVGGMLEFEAQSDFLTARYANEQFNMNWVDVAKEKAMIPFEAIDRFAANAVVRTYQKIGLKKGWTPEVAMKWADQMAWRMMASTNTGEGANIMSSKTAGILLQFSREGINNLQFLTHDLPEISRGGGDWLKKLLGILIGGWIYNEAFNKSTALDVITPTEQSIREWDTDKSLLSNLGNTVGNYAEMLNPTNLGTGGDLTELPLFSNLSDLGKAAWNTADSALQKDGRGVRDGLTDFFCATLGFVPGGLSMERLATGIGDYYRGYTTDSAGNIKFTIDNDLFSAGSIHDAIFTLLLSSSGTFGGREYTRSGYQKMTSTQTEAFHSQKATGMSNQEAFDSVNAYAEQTGRRNASAMVLPDWAAEKADTDWMKAVLEEGTEAYPKKTPGSMTVHDVKRDLTDEEKKRFEQLYRTAYSMYITKAMAEGENLAKAAEKAYSKAYSNFRKELEE